MEDVGQHCRNRTGRMRISIDIYLDMYARYVYYYYNNKLLGKDKICPDLKQLWGVDFTVEKGRCVIDNYKLERLDFAIAKGAFGKRS